MGLDNLPPVRSRGWLLALLTTMRPTDVFRADSAWLEFDPAAWEETPEGQRVMTFQVSKRGRIHSLYICKTLADALERGTPAGEVLETEIDGMPFRYSLERS